MAFILPYPVVIPAHEVQGVQVVEARTWVMKEGTPSPLNRVQVVASTPMVESRLPGDSSNGNLPVTPLKAIDGEHAQPKWAADHKPIMVLYFMFDNDQLTKYSVDRLTHLKKGCYHIVGSADPTGAAAYNADLSLRRAKTVAHKLADSGSHADAVGMGEINGIPHSSDRRAEIYKCVP